MRFRLPQALDLPCTNQCSWIGFMFTPLLLPTMSSCMHEAATGLLFIQLHITTKIPPQCVIIILISRRPLNPLSPLLRDSGPQCRPYPLDYSTLPNSCRFAPGSRLTFRQGYLSVSQPFTQLAYLLFSKVSGCPCRRGIRTLSKPARKTFFFLPPEVALVKATLSIQMPVHQHPSE